MKHRSMKRRRSRSRSVGKSRSRSMRRTRSMRGGKLSGDSSYSTLISSSSDNSNYITGQSGDYQQNVDRNNSLLSNEGNNVNMSQFKGLIPPGAYYGGKRRRSRSRSRKMRGGVGENGIGLNGDISESGAGMDGKGGEWNLVSDQEKNADAQMGGRRRRRRMRGGDDMAAMNPDTAPIPNGGMYNPPQGPGSTPTSGGMRQKRRGGGVIATAALPFGLFGLQKYFQGRKSENGTRRHRRRRS